MNNSVKLSDLIAPSFYSLYWDVTENKYTHYMLNGGRIKRLNRKGELCQGKTCEDRNGTFYGCGTA